MFTTGYNPMVDYTFHFDAWASASGGYMDLHASWAVSTGSTLNIAFVEDPGTGPDSYVDLSATYTDQQHVTHTIPHSLTMDPSGIYRFSADFSVRESLCGPTGCNPPDCVNHPDCYSHPVFSDAQSIDVTVVGDGAPEILDASHTFQTTLVSEDPNFRLVSGFDSVSAPEPQPFVLIGVALIGYAIIVRRWGRT
jgi:hypothetical protein